MKEPIILIGGGGHCKACIDVIEAESNYKIAGIVDVKEKIGQKVMQYDIIACDEDLSMMIKEYKNYFITIGQLKSLNIRNQLFEKILTLGGYFPRIISPKAYVSSRAFIDKGTIIMHGVIINSEARVGRNCIVNTGAIIEHESIAEDYCHFSTRCVVNGQCKIGKGVFIGSNATIKESIQIVSNTIIAAGAVVINNIELPGTYIGIPARRKERA